MKKQTKTTGCILSLAVLTALVCPPLPSTAQTLRMELKNPLEIGKGALMFAQIVSVVEDEKGNFYILDDMEHTVHMFSPAGDPIRHFGRKGQGPGEFQYPARLALTLSGNLVVAEDAAYVTFLKPDGKFIKRIHFNSRFGLGYIGENRFYAWSWGEGNHRQHMFNAANEITESFHSVNINEFSASAPDETGRAVMFNYGPDTYAASLVFDQNRGHAALGISSLYEIRILDSTGKTTTLIKRDIEPEKLSNEEKDYYLEDISAIAKKRGWPRRVVRDLGANIPKTKVYFNSLRLSPSHLFVFRIPPNITREEDPIPVDIFNLKGQFLGSASLPGRVLHISSRYIYLVKTDELDNFYLIRMEYDWE